MALVACEECGRQISDQAEACPNCGRPNRPRPVAIPAQGSNGSSDRRKTGCAVVVLIGAVAVLVAMCSPRSDHTPSPGERSGTAPSEQPEQKRARLFAEMNDTSRFAEARLLTAKELAASFAGTTEGSEASKLIPELEESVRKANLGKQWVYRSSDDPMTSKAWVTAEVTSSNTHEFDRPYSRPQHATLTVRKHPQHGSDVIMSIERGQLLCRSYSGCKVLVRFGDEEPRTYEAAGPSDNSTTLLFIRGYADFVRRMKDADIVRIQAEVYQEGSPAWEFETSGFDPSKLK
ncbi:hypothetical protein SRABI81_01321 [Stenotrophomonas lactitubi]|nr:hypothetical protein SRABI81_01321 [Stenotrophomonas lactitubi]CAH0175443.1 hypothetical protein SRABI122_01289 [Stenotrophomonas lactitubi]